MTIHRLALARAILADVKAMDKRRSRSDDLIAFARALRRALEEDPNSIAPQIQLELYDAFIDRLAHFGTISNPEMHSELAPYLLRYVEGTTPEMKRSRIAAAVSAKRKELSAA